MDTQPHKISISLNGEFTATELEEIIRDLAKARAAMQPAVPLSLEGAVMTGLESLIEVAPVFRFATLANGGLRIHLRNSGLGWLAFEIDATERGHVLSLIADQLEDTHRPH